MSFDAGAHVRQALPTAGKSFHPGISESLSISREVLTLCEGLGTGGEEVFGLIDICGNNIDLMLDRAEAVVPVSPTADPDTWLILLDSIELHPVNLV